MCLQQNLMRDEAGKTPVTRPVTQTNFDARHNVDTVKAVVGTVC